MSLPAARLHRGFPRPAPWLSAKLGLMAVGPRRDLAVPRRDLAVPRRDLAVPRRD